MSKIVLMTDSASDIPVELEREHRMQEAVIGIKREFGKNAILKGMNLEEGAMTRERNHQIGGHRSGE